MRRSVPFQMKNPRPLFTKDEDQPAVPPSLVESRSICPILNPLDLRRLTKPTRATLFPRCRVRRFGGSGHELPGEFPRAVRVFFSNWTLSRGTETAVLFPIKALACACVLSHYATRYGIRKTNQRAIIHEMEIRTITRSDAPALLEVLRAAGPHGHREWPTNNVSSLIAALQNPRLDPDLGRFSVGFVDDTPVGYALAEPELNIGRVLVGIATSPKHGEHLDSLLKDGIGRAIDIADQDDFEIHVAARDSEPEIVTEVLARRGFTVVRTALKMRVETQEVALRPAEIPSGSSLRYADMTDQSEAAAVTALHNACFSDSWGFSPNSVDEINGRSETNAQRNGFPPILVAEDISTGALNAYIWVTLSNGEGRVEMVGVDPGLRGAGLGWVIFNAGVNLLIENGATTLVLDVDSENPPARRIYESAGYRTYSEVRYYGLKVSLG